MDGLTLAIPSASADSKILEKGRHSVTSWLPSWTSRKFVLLNFLFFVLAVGFTALTILALTIVSGLRSEVSAETLFAKYEKDAALFLRRYVEDGKERDYQRYGEDAKVAARYADSLQALDKALYGEAETSRPVRENGSGVFAAIKGVQRFRGFPFIGNGIQISSRAREFDRQLEDLGAQARLSDPSGRISVRGRNDLLARIDDLSDRLILLEENFSRSMATGSRWVSGTTIYILLVSDLGLLLLGFLFSTYFGRMVVRQIDKVSLAVNSIAHGDLSARCAVAGGDDFMRLAQGVNQMASSIEHTQTELKYARDKALQASRVKSEFLANMSHEIRTPLNVVIGYTDLLATQIEVQGNEDVQENLDSIRRAGRRLIRTIQGILDFSKIEARSFELRPEPLELGKTLERHVQDLRILSERKNIQLVCTINEPEATVLFDEYCLSGALTNLLQNAIKFTKEGSITVSLCRAPDRRLKVAVKDTGIGIDASYLTRIFEPFSQEESGFRRSFEGNGLGLALTKRYLELNGATIEVQSRKGQGAVFTITFSAESELEPGISQPSESAPTNGVAHHTNLKKAVILVVEDDEENQTLTRKILESQFEVRMASSADEARRELEGNSVNLILMDWSLQGAEDGVTLTRSLRQDERFMKIPVVALTAHAMPEDRKLAIATGFDAFLGKPIEADELFRTLDLLIH
jgi:signal transduction histidine kinase/CheY-like chemotaxis protein